jgi:hypothetical protein
MLPAAADATCSPAGKPRCNAEVADEYLSIPWWLIDRRGGNFTAARRKYLFLDGSRRTQSRLKKDPGIHSVRNLDEGSGFVVIFIGTKSR